LPSIKHSFILTKPRAEINRIWIELTNDKIGFYTSLNSDNIPTLPGVYAWFYPLNIKLKDSDKALTDFLREVRKIQTYDPVIDKIDQHEFDIDFNWDPLIAETSVRKNPEKINLTPTTENEWKTVSGLSDEVIRTTKLYALLGTIFTRPLYIGMTENLNERYEQHINGYGSGSTFHKRFNDHMSKLDINKEVRDLLFVCIPIIKVGKFSDKLYQRQRSLIETILKILGQPIFSIK